MRVPISAFVAGKAGLREYPGFVGVFTRKQYELAEFANGSRVRKSGSEPGDDHPNGSLGTVLGSIGTPSAPGIVMYFVAWDRSPNRAIAVMKQKLEKA